jgi:hypothetical protein
MRRALIKGLKEASAPLSAESTPKGEKRPFGVDSVHLFHKRLIMEYT